MFVYLCVCPSVYEHDNSKTSKYKYMEFGMQSYDNYFNVLSHFGTNLIIGNGARSVRVLKHYKPIPELDK